jgi:hypothetical protein
MVSQTRSGRMYIISGLLSYHVMISDCYSCSQVVLVKYSLEFLIGESRALGKTRSSPWIEGSPLKLNNIDVRL